MIAITRKNFLFLGSEAGGERAAILYTALESAKLIGLDRKLGSANAIVSHGKGPPDRPDRRTAPVELEQPNRQPRRLTMVAVFS